MLMGAPPMEAQQDCSIDILDLTKVVMARRRRGLTKERLVPSEGLDGTSRTPMIVQVRFIAPTHMIEPNISRIAPFFIVKNVPAALSTRLLYPSAAKE